jgi:hypothetical protein
MELIIHKQEHPTELQKFFMETDTPKTDANEFWGRDMGGDSGPPHERMVIADFSRELEREAAMLRKFSERGYNMAMGDCDPEDRDDYIADWNAYLSNASRQQSLPADGSTSTQSVGG